MEGQKRGCWSWYVFPVAPWVVNGREQGSFHNMRYALRDSRKALTGDKAAWAYLTLPETDGINLRKNYIQTMTVVAEQIEGGVEPQRLVGIVDLPKLRSSLELFARVSGPTKPTGAEGEPRDHEVYKACKRALEAIGAVGEREKRRTEAV